MSWLSNINFIGYDVSIALNSELDFNKLLIIYCSHFKYYKNYYYNKKHIYKVIELHFFNKLLTKIKK